MQNFSSMRIEVWNDGSHKMLAIRAEVEESQGLNHIWFVLTRHELFELNQGRIQTFVDCNHNLKVSGDSWTFYDMEIPYHSVAGEFKVKYLTATVPRFFSEILQSMCERIWNKGDKEKTTIELSQKYRKKIVRLYGQGKGRAKLIFSEHSPETSLSWNSLLRNPNFEEKAERLIQIAKNSTKCFYESATLHIHPDSDGFYWTAVSPSGKRILSGGLINHSSDGNDWSIHT